VRNIKEEAVAAERVCVQINNHCSPAVRRKPSQPENVLRESCDEYRELDVLLEKI
jgi:hypothetical protein